MQTSTSNFFVGEWLVEPQLNRLTGKHGSAVVEPKVMEVLVHLAAHPGDVQTREQLLESVWEDTVVTDYVVSRSISKLRKVFDDSYRAPRYIETVSKTGYRLIAPVTHVDVAAEDAEEPVLWHGDSHPEAPTGIEVVPALFQPRMGLPVARGRRRFWIGAGLTTVLLGMLAWLSIALTSSSPQEPPSLSPLTSFPGVEAYPTFSPDGSMISFQGEGVAGQPDLFVRHVNAETVLRLTEDPAVDFSPAWSPDGAFVAFQRFSSDQCSLYVVPVFGGSERKLGDCPLTQRGLAWSPDGSWFAVTDREALDQPRRIYLVDPQSLERQPLTDPHTPLSDYYPRFSPDGQHVAFLRGGDLQITDLYVMPIDGRKAPRRLTFDDRHIARFSWTPDGRSLLFASSRSGDYRIWRIPISGGEPEWFSEVGTLDPGGLTLASTRNQMAYEEWYHEINIWEVDLTDATQTAASGESSSLSRLFASTRWDFQPQFSPDGSQVVFVSNRSGHPELWIGQHDGSDATPLVSLEGAFLRMPRWSPDGKHIAFEAFVEGRSTVFVVDAKGGNRTT